MGCDAVTTGKRVGEDTEFEVSYGMYIHMESELPVTYMELRTRVMITMGDISNSVGA